MAAADIFTRADPNDVRIVGIDGYVTNGVGFLFVKNRGPGDAGIFRFPHSPRAHGDIPGITLLRMYGDIGDAAAHQGRADTAELQTLCCCSDRFRVSSVQRLTGNGQGRGCGEDKIG